MKDIELFLPKYPNINNDINDIFNLYDDNFYQSIYNKKEFNEEKLEKTEFIPTNKGELLRHQKIISRFLSSYTLYNELLLFHLMGTGKSCVSVGVVEKIREEGNFAGALYIAKGWSLIDNFMNEIIFKCTDGSYIPANYDKLTKLERSHRKHKMLKKFYEFNTMESFAKKISKSSKADLMKYNNYVIIIDEVHNLRIKDKKTGLDIYKQFFKFLHTIKNCKILVMSGTPMKDNVNEIAAIMNLILPLEKQMPTSDDFMNEFFIKQNDKLSLNQDKIPLLKDYFKGRVSYLKPVESNLEIILEGNIYGELKYLNVCTDIMSDFQSKYYKDAYDLDMSGENKSIYSNSRQASLFVFPDGSSGTLGFTKYIEKNKKKYKLKQELITELSDDTDEKRLEKLKKYSSKYYDSVKNILKAKQEGKLVFVYNEFVKGSGLILFGLILQLFGFEKYKNKESRNSYAIITNTEDTNIQNTLKIFNNPGNSRGGIINVILGSRKIAEGFSFKNIQIEDIHTPWYNYSETSQVIARGIRFGSHKQLEIEGISPKVQIYQRVSLPQNDTKSIDLTMYEYSEKKDILIKIVERVIKESSFDCNLTYERNKSIGKDGLRDCDYMDCDYVCDGNVNTQTNSIDSSTYDLYYNKHVIEEIIQKIKDIFKTRFKISLKNIQEILPEYSIFEIITSFRKIINENIQVYNKYGFSSYIKEINNDFFLIKSLSVKDNIMIDYYTENPNIQDNKTWSQIISNIELLQTKKDIKELFSTQDKNIIHKLLDKLPIDIQEFILEIAIKDKEKNIIKSFTSDIILEYYKNYYKTIDDIVISELLYEKNNSLRCFEQNEWKECSEDYTNRFLDIKKERLTELENNSFGYYGIYTKDKFCLRDVKNREIQKGHQETSGKVCQHWAGKALIKIAYEELQIDVEEKDINPIISDKYKELKDEITKEKIINIIKTRNNIKHYAEKDIDLVKLKTILYFDTITKTELCSKIREFLETHNLIIEDKSCGNTNKTKFK